MVLRLFGRSLLSLGLAIVLLCMVRLVMVTQVQAQTQTQTEVQAPEYCFKGVGCLDTVYARLADLQEQDCAALAAMRSVLMAKRPGKARTLKERSNLRSITRVERQKKCNAIAAAPKPSGLPGDAAASDAKTTAPKKKARTSAANEPTVASAEPPPPPAPGPAKDVASSTLPAGAPVAVGAPAPASAPKPEAAPVVVKKAGSSESPAEPVIEELGAAPAAAAAAGSSQAGASTTGAASKPDTRTANAAAKPGTEPYFTQIVFYGTNRKRTTYDEPNLKYGGDRGDLVYGVAEVSIPRNHKPGELEAPQLIKLEFWEDPAKHLVLLKAEEKPRDAYFAEVAARVAQAPESNAFIFVHGYNVTFKDAARRTAQMAYDLRFPGVPAFFSWPSQGTTLGYKFDESNVEWSVPDLKLFIADFAEKSTANNIYLVGHSMGTRALVTAAKELIQEQPAIKQKLREIILAAPDIDAGIFERSIAPAFKDLNLVTLYASSKDLALVLSKEFNGYPRAGDSGVGLIVQPGIDTIEASDVDTDFLGHAYYGASTSIITDIYQIVRGNTAPANRPHLKSVTDQLGAYWKMLRIEGQ